MHFFVPHDSMLITFKTAREEKFYSCEKDLTLKYNIRMARKICQRLNELTAAETPQQLPRNARFHEHQGNRKGFFSIDLIHPFRLIVRPTCCYASWVEIVSLEVYEIIDPH